MNSLMSKAQKIEILYYTVNELDTYVSLGIHKNNMIKF
jgi:hypothetical protein